MKRPSRKAAILLASFFLPACLMTVCLALAGITPFGSRSLGVQDMSNQYLAFLSALRDMLTGKASFLYLPSLALGGGTSGVLAYYLLSPLNLITCLFPRHGLLTAVTVTYILRVGLCGLTMAIYCGGRRGWSWRVLIGAMGYALMGYMTAYSINYQWHDSLILLPLIALGIARLAEGRGRWLYTLSLAAALAVNFYIGYMLCIFSVLFFLFEALTGQNSRPGRTAGTFLLGSLTAGALAAVVLVPAFLALSGGKAGLSLSDFSLRIKFPLPSLFVKLFPGTFDFDELTPAGLPNIFTGTVTLALAVLYLANGSVPRRRRAGGALLAGALVASFCVSALDLVWHGMNVPEWYNYRYSFLFSFLLAAGADAALAGLREGARSWHLLLPVAAVALAAGLAFIGRSYGFTSWQIALWSLAVTALLCGTLYLALRPGTAPRALAAAGALILVLHAADLGLGAKLSLDGLTVSSSNSAQWSAYVSQKEQALALADTGSAFIRIESPDRFDQDRCEPMLFGYDGLSHYSSTVPQKNLDLLQRLGLIRYEDLYALYGAGTTAGADSLLGVGRLVTTGTAKPYTPIAVSGPYTVCENPYALPIGWTADEAIAQAVDSPDCFGYIQALYDAAAPEVDRDIYTAPELTDVSMEGLTEQPDGLLVLDGASGTVTYTLTAQADGPLYGVLDIPDWPGVMVSVDGAVPIFYANAQQNGCLFLGTFAAGQVLTVQVQAFTDLRVDHAAFATESAEALAAYKRAIDTGGCPLTKLSGHHFTGSFTTGSGDSLLVLTIPYDPAWRITLDGQRVQAQQVQDCLTAIPVTAGEHAIEMRYTPAGLIPGACVTAAAAALCLLFGLKKRRG